MPDLSDLAARMASWQKVLPVSASNLALNAAATMVEGLVLDTPVDTSQAMSNWTVGINEQPTDFIGPLVPGQKGSTQGASADEAYQAALAVLASKQPGDTIYISNNAPYILELNNGSSAQAPTGFIETTTLVAFQTLGNRGGLKLDG